MLRQQRVPKLLGALLLLAGCCLTRWQSPQKGQQLQTISPPSWLPVSQLILRPELGSPPWDHSQPSSCEQPPALCSSQKAIQLQWPRLPRRCYHHLYMLLDSRPHHSGCTLQAGPSLIIIHLRQGELPLRLSNPARPASLQKMWICRWAGGCGRACWATTTWSTAWSSTPRCR